LHALWREVEPRGYAYALSPHGLVSAFMLALLARLPGLRAVTQRCPRLVGTRNFSSLAAALRRPSLLRFARALVEQLQGAWRGQGGQLVALDSMAVTLRSTLRHHCAKSNRHTAGGGVVWAYLIKARRGVCPVQVLEIVRGAWHDSKILRTVSLCAHGPVYLMDRGFYCFDLLEQWLAQGVHFIVRVRERSLLYEVIEPCSAPRRIDALWLELDARVKLGGRTAKTHPCVRLIIARLASGQRLILASERWAWSAERILRAYNQRWQIERFHKLVKEALGLAHLYSFTQNGLEFLLWTALLLALLLFASATPEHAGWTIDTLREALRAARALLGLGALWRRNACITPGRRKSAKKKQQTIIQ